MGEHNWAELIGMFIITIVKFIFSQLDKIFIFFGGAGGGIFTKWFINRIKKKRLEAVEVRLNHLNEINHALRRLTGETFFKTAIVVKGHNGTGIPEPGKVYKITSLHAENVDVKRAIGLQNKYSDIRVDYFFIEKLLELVKNKEVKITLNTNEETSVPHSTVIYNLLKSEGCNYSEMHYIAVSKKELIFLILGAENNHEFKHTQLPETTNKVNIEVSKIRKIFSQYYS